MFKSMPVDKYILDRLEQYLTWYDNKAVGAKRWYIRIRVIAVVGAVIVPVSANLISSAEAARYATTALGLLVSLVVAVDGIFHYGDQWKNYRSTEQFLKREKFLFQTGEGIYKGLDADKAFALLVDRCEAQIAAENAATLNVIAASSQDSV